MADGQISRDELRKMKLFYETHGSGKPLILIPGFASGAWTWFRQIGDLSKDFRVITFDPRGIGRSKLETPPEAENLSIKTFVGDVLKMLDDLEIEKVNMLGASFGGFVAQQFALDFPARVDKLILACTSAGGANHVRPAIEILRSFSPDPNLTVGEHIRKFIRPAFTAEFNAEKAVEVEEVCRMRESNTVADPIYFAQLEVAFSFNTEDQVDAIENETLVLSGDLDTVVPMQNSVNLAEKLPNAQLKIIENGSHMFFIENAGEFNQAVKDFLK
jgi:pimeloyl-ACP methyl ester carboxylesterase